MTTIMTTTMMMMRTTMRTKIWTTIRTVMRTTMMTIMMRTTMRRMMRTRKIAQAKLMGKRTDEVAKMIVEHYKLPMEPKDWIDRSRCLHD